MLIKSFAGFRPAAVRDEIGAWVIGYGHTKSAREDARVSEAEAELLLQYDLLAVTAAVNAASVPLNQHQFDALASFAFSVGVERFNASDVLQRLKAGQASQAADAMIGWPEPIPPQAALRRRTAERALFNADPSADVALVDLLGAPLPGPHGVLAAKTASPTIAETRYHPYGAPIVGALPLKAEPSVVEATEDVTSATAALIADTVAEPAIAPIVVEPSFAEPSVAEPAPAHVTPDPIQDMRSVLRHEAAAAPKAEPVNWGETIVFAILAAFGVVAIGIGMGAFRLAGRQSTGAGDTLLVGTVLAVVGLACAVMAGWKLYRLWGPQAQKPAPAPEFADTAE